MKLAIHHCPGSFSDKWIEYCKKNSINYKIVNCYDTDIIEQLNKCDGLMWHWLHYDYKAKMVARQLTYSLELIGKKVFPNSKTSWHFDDKVGQKYLFEAIKAPLVQTYVFYDKNEAIDWANTVQYPIVFKLRNGAGSMNVKLVKNRTHALSLIKKSFGSGFSPFDNKEKVKNRWGILKRSVDKTSIYSLIRGIALYLFPVLDHNYQLSPREKGYIYFQDFVPNNNFDIRVIVIGEKAFAIKRMVLNGDFKASGSGNIIYDKNEIPTNIIQLAFNLNEYLNTQCVAYDFIFMDKSVKLIEISYSFNSKPYNHCPGYWDSDLNWHEGKFVPEYFMIKNFINFIRN